MDRRQFIKYVESNQKAVRRFLTALCCGDSEMADDLAQDTFLKAYLACDGFREDSKFTTWIYRIAYNTFLTSRRKLHIDAPLSEAEAIASREHTDGGFEYQALYVALEQLTESERTTVLLHYMEGYNLKEIADITGANVDAVKQRLTRGRRHLKDLMNDYEKQ